ncbi:MAG TPA: SH3 domain-containing protein [Devosia sp.]|nr:SH3 domain-containing protein [Devosia sp.]
MSVTIVVMAFFGVATGALPVRCWIGGLCSASSDPAAVGLGAPRSASADPSPVAPAAEAEKPVQMAIAAPANQVRSPSGPTLTNNDVIGATFSQLKVDFQAPNSLPASPAKLAAAQPLAAPPPLQPEAESAGPTEGGLTRRVVSTVSIRADGTPELGTNVAEAYAPAPKVPGTAPSPALDAAARIGAGQTPVAEVAPAVDLRPEAAATKPAGSKAGLATVLGQGANVRANPSKAGKVLFAINGGEKVTVLESRRGWLRIKDDQGRIGWIYADGVRRA